MPNILVIDDNGELQKIYKEVFTDAGFRVAETDNGQQGVAVARETQPDIILLDIMLGSGKNGFDVLEELKRHPHTQHIPVVVLTNLDSEEQMARKMGVHHYLIKANTSFDQLLTIVKSLLPQNVQDQVKMPTVKS